MKRKSFATVASLVLAATVSITAMLDKAAAELSGRSVKIGVMVPLTGKGAEWGAAAQMGSEMAAEEINKAGGIGGVKLKLVFYDTHTREADGITIINKLATRDKVLAVSGPCFSSLCEVISRCSTSSKCRRFPTARRNRASPSSPPGHSATR